MEKFTQHQGFVAPLAQANVDTDQIIPKQFLTAITRQGFGKNLFDAWRYLDEGFPGKAQEKRIINPEFVLNQAPYTQASILLAQANFGCGSSREHAAWALLDYGFRVIIAPSFADIFYNNAFNNGLLLIVLSQEKVDKLFAAVSRQADYQLEVDLESQKIVTPEKQILNFEMDPSRRYRLLNGLDDIALTLTHRAAIENFERNHRQSQPWLFNRG